MPGFWETITTPIKKAAKTVASWFEQYKEPTPEGYKPFKSVPVETMAQLFGVGKRTSAIKETIEKPRETMEEFLKQGEEKKLKETIEKGEKPPDFWYYFPRELGKETFATTLEIAKSLIKAPFKITKTFAYHPLYYHQKEPEWKVPGLGEITSYAQDTEKRLKELQDQGMDDRTAAIATILGVGGEAILDVSIVAGWLESGAKALAKNLTPELQEKVAAWKLLGEPNTPEEVKTTFYKLSHQFHPDKFGGDDSAFKEINNAYQILSVKGGLPTAKELLTAKAARVGQAMISPISKIMELPRPTVILPFKMLPEKAGYIPEEPFKPYYEPAMGLSIKSTPMKPVVPPAVAKEGAEGVKEIIQYELPANLMPARGLPTWKHSKILWNTMRNQFGQANKLGEDMTRNRGTVAWIIDTLEGGKRELAPLTEKYLGQAMTRKQYGKLYAMFKAHDYNIEGYKKVMATLKGIEPVITTITTPIKEVAKAMEGIPSITPTESGFLAKKADGTQQLFKDQNEAYKFLEIEKPKIKPAEVMKYKSAEELIQENKIRPVSHGFGVGKAWEYRAEDGIFTVAPSKEEAIKRVTEALKIKPEIPPKLQPLAQEVRINTTIQEYKDALKELKTRLGKPVYRGDLEKVDAATIRGRIMGIEDAINDLEKIKSEIIKPPATAEIAKPTPAEKLFTQLFRKTELKTPEKIVLEAGQREAAISEAEAAMIPYENLKGETAFYSELNKGKAEHTKALIREIADMGYKPQIVGHPNIAATYTVRPYTLGYGCDGSTSGNVLYLAEDMAKKTGLDFEAIYKKAYPGEEIPKDLEKYAKETLLPKTWGQKEIKTVIGDLDEVNSHSLADELTDAIKKPPRFGDRINALTPGQKAIYKNKLAKLKEGGMDYTTARYQALARAETAEKMTIEEAQTFVKEEERKIAERAEEIRMKSKPEVKELEEINKKATPVRKAGKEIAPKQMRLDEIKPAPPGEPPPPEEIPLAIAPPPPEGSGLEAIDKMVGKVSKVRGIWEWLKGRPKAFKELFTDRFSAMKTFEDNISKAAGKAIDINASPYVEARMYAGRIGTIEMNLADLQKIVAPLRKYRPDFTRFTLSKRAAERAARGFKNPAGVTEEQATRALAEIKAKVGEKVFGLFETTEGAIQNWADKAILKPALNTGIISKKAYEAIVTKNKHWMPFQVLDYLPTSAEAEMIPVGSETFSVSKQGIIKALKGTEKTIRDPFEAIIDRLSESVNLTKRNEVARKLIALRKQFPEAKELIKPLARVSKEIDKATGKKKLIWDLRTPKGWDSISVFIKGKVTKWAVPEDLGWAMHQMSPAEAGMVSNFVRFTSAAFRKGATNLYIPFSLSNAFRDAQMAIMCSKWGFNPADWLKGFGAGLKGSFGWESKLFNEFHRNAGGYGGFIQNARDISGVRKALFTPSWWTKTKAVINPFNLISNFAEAIELAPRLGVYAKGLKKGVTPLEAAFEARRVTIDFARAGQQARIINSWIPFVNARWQALLNTARVFKDHPFRSAARVMALVVAPGVATYLWNTMNYPDLYDDIPQWAKDTYFIMIVGEDVNEKGERVPKIIQIPKGDVGQIFYNPIEYALEYVRKGEPQNWFRLALEWTSQISPIPFTRDGEPSATSFLSGALPPVLRTPIELATNQSFFMGYPIVPRGLEQVAPSEQYNEKTPELAITIGRALGISPMKLAYGVNGMLGGFGREAIDPSKILELSIQRFYRTSGGAKRNEAWNLLDDLTVGYNTARVQAKRAIEQGQPEAADALMKEWNSKAESVIPDITNIIAQDDPEEAQSIAKKITFQASDIARLKKTVQEEIAAIKKTPTATSKEGYWGAESAPMTMGELFPAQPTEKVVTGYWK